MPWQLYVANLDHAVGRAELEGVFAGHGAVRARMIDPYETSNGTTTGLVEVESESRGTAAIAALNGTVHRGSPMVVAWATAGSPGTARLPGTRELAQHEALLKKLDSAYPVAHVPASASV